MLDPEHLNPLFDILNKLHFVSDPAQLWPFVLEESCRTLQAEAGTYFELSAQGRELRVMATCGIEETKLQRLPFPIGSGISGWVAQYRQPALVNDVSQDHRFNASVDRIMGFNTRSILCVPVLSTKGLEGVMEIINRKVDLFTPLDQEFMTLLGRQASIAAQNLFLWSEVRSKEMLLQNLLANFSAGLIAIDGAGGVTVLNPAARMILGLPPAAAVGQPAAEVLNTVPWLLETLEKTIANRRAVSRQETRLTLESRSVRLGYTTILIAGADQQVMGAGIIFQKLDA
jgi:adenylate cyclase